MSIDLSQTYAPQGTVSFLVTNTDTMKHEFVVLQTDTPAADFPISSFEGESNRFNEDKAGTNVGETGDMEAGTSQVLTIDLKAGHYAVVCNLPGHYAAGMHQDFWVTPPGATAVPVTLSSSSPTDMSITLGQDFAPTGKVSFLVANTDSMKHEFVVLATKTPAADFPISSFEGESNRFNEDKAGTNVGETGDMEAGAVMMLTIDLKSGHYAVVCNLPGHYAAGMHQDFWVTPAGATPVSVTLSSTSSTDMSIDLSQTYAPQGTVSFLVTNTDTMKHEFVVLQTDTPAADFPISSFEGESNRFNEDKAGTNVGETGDMEAGTSQVLTIDLKAGHYAVVCNLPGHYAAGMHQDFWVTPPGATAVPVTLSSSSPTDMSITLGQDFAPTGKVSFLVANTDSMKHEFVVLATKTPAADFPISSFEGESNRFNEDKAGTNVGETGDMEAGAVMMLTIDLKSGHYAVVCNLPGHYAAGMHQDFWVTPAGATPVSVTLSSTSSTDMSIDLSQTYAPQGTVSFLVTNTDTMKHEFVVLQTDTPAADFPISSFEGESNRFNEDKAGTNVGETGDMEAGTSQVLTIDLKAGHYAVVCNLPGHYAAGMHQDFWVTPLAS